MNSKPLVLYHASCADGFCAAWLAYRQFRSDADYIAVQYHEPPPAEAFSGRPVYILDFSYKADIIEEMVSKAWHLVVLDHHKTAKAELEPLQKKYDINEAHVLIRFDMAKSGGRLAWEYFYPKLKDDAPWLVRYTEDRDLWKWQLDDSRAVSAFLASHPFDFKLWEGFDICDEADSAWWDGMVAEGYAILRYQRQLVERAVANAASVTIGGYSDILCVNSTVLQSEIGQELAQDRPFGATWFQKPDGSMVFSLRSTEAGIDVSEVAKRYGGGGHKHAAGFTLPNRAWIKIDTDPQISTRGPVTESLL